MPQIAADLFIPVSLILMLVGLVVSFIPVMPGSLVVWAIALVAGIIDGFNRITPTAMVIMTLIMVISQLSDLWLPLLGVQTGGMGCLTSIGSFVGGIVGTLLIPIPLLGTLIGCVVGALVVEFVQRQRMEDAVAAGRTAAKLFAIGYGIRIVSSVLVVLVFIASILIMR